MISGASIVACALTGVVVVVGVLAALAEVDCALLEMADVASVVVDGICAGPGAAETACVLADVAVVCAALAESFGAGFEDSLALIIVVNVQNEIYVTDVVLTSSPMSLLL